MAKKSKRIGTVSAGGKADFCGFSGQEMETADRSFETWLEWQANMLKAVAPMGADWVERQREGVEAAARTFGRLAACQNFAEAAEVQREWLEGATKRLESDMRAFMGQDVTRPRKVRSIPVKKQTSKEAEQPAKPPASRAVA